MSRLQKSLILYSLLSTLGLLMASCLLKRKQFDVRLDASDVLEYGLAVVNLVLIGRKLLFLVMVM